jgi:UDP-GlcNAc:undecaprenyl-phosphate/decaprenyl-phosphate GlcNAc-1-phosphate transferase
VVSSLSHLAPAALAFGVAVVATPLARGVARRLDIVDPPGPMKPQAAPVPYLGGTALLLGVVVGLVAWELAPLVVLVPAFLLGLVDDARPIRPPVRLVIELIIGVGVATTVPSRGPLASLAVVGITVTLINAVNFLDGLDGLAGGVALASALGFALVLDPPFLALALSGAVAGVLLYNRPPARIYLGDSGSYLIGAALAWLLASAWAPGTSDGLFATAVLFVAVPCAEIAADVLRRIRNAVPLFAHERTHVYDQLVARGWSSGAVTGIFIVIQALFTGCALWASRLGIAAITVVGASAVLLLGIFVAGGFLSATGPVRRQ